MSLLYVHMYTHLRMSLLLSELWCSKLQWKNRASPESEKNYNVCIYWFYFLKINIVRYNYWKRKILSRSSFPYVQTAIFFSTWIKRNSILFCLGGHQYARANTRIAYEFIKFMSFLLQVNKLYKNYSRFHSSSNTVSAWYNIRMKKGI